MGAMRALCSNFPVGKRFSFSVGKQLQAHSVFPAGECWQINLPAGKRYEASIAKEIREDSGSGDPWVISAAANSAQRVPQATTLRSSFTRYRM